MVEPMERGFPVVLILCHQVSQHIVLHHLHIEALDGLGIDLVHGPDEVQLLVYRLPVLLIGDVALVVHQGQDQLLAVLVPLPAGEGETQVPVGDGVGDEGVVLGGVVGDADDAGALRQGQVPDILAEVGLSGGGDAVAALPEEHRIQIPFDDLCLVVGALQLQCLKNLQELAAHQVRPVAGVVLDQLLGDGGAAEVVGHAEKHLHHRAGGAVPVHPPVLIEALVLDGHQGVLHHLVFGKIFIIHPDAVHGGGEHQQLVGLALAVRVPDGAAQVHGGVFQRYFELGIQLGFHIICENAGEDEAGQDGDHHHAEDDPYNQAQNAADGPLRRVSGGGNLLGVFLIQFAAASISQRERRFPDSDSYV